jgi:hypothetical protein
MTQKALRCTLAVVAILAVITDRTANGEEARAMRPNVLVILTDDKYYDLLSGTSKDRGKSEKSYAFLSVSAPSRITRNHLEFRGSQGS